MREPETSTDSTESASDGAAVDTLIGRAGRAAGWLARTGWRVTRGLPGGELAERQFLRLEKAVVDQVHRRIDPTPAQRWWLPGRGVLDPLLDRTRVGDHELVTLIRPANGSVAPLRAGMAELLNQSANADPARATEHLYTTILRQLMPDEARILAALADGEPRPAVDVLLRTPLGGTRRVLLRNASSVGRHAGVSEPGLVPTYLTRLCRLGVVDIGEEDPDLGDQYDTLLTERLVRDAGDRARRARRGGPRFVRRTVMISELGRGFWAACDPLNHDASPIVDPSPVASTG